MTLATTPATRAAAAIPGRQPRRRLFPLILATCVALPAHAQQSGFSAELAAMSLEQLMNIEVSSVSRRGEELGGAAASVFVITADDIRRSGASSLPEILRLAPNLQVARVNAYEYAITARGFNNRVGNKLLVLIDGRTIYTPMFSGVFWEMQDTDLEDIARVEVISGPGGTLWGANAVNGVINIITRPANETRSTLVAADAGNYEKGSTVRTGGRLGSQIDWRAYAKVRGWDRTFNANGSRSIDEWRRKQVGFRVDWNGGDQALVVQGDTMRGESQHRGIFGPYVVPAVEVSSSNLLALWTRQLGENSDLQVQAYWSRNDRNEYILFSPESDIYDLDIKHHMSLDGPLGRHEVVWGGGYRHADDEVSPGLFTIYIPDARRLDWQNLFVQDEISLGENLRLTPGIKLEWNDYTGREQLPSLRLAWTGLEDHLLWAGFSRAVRAPSRFDRDVYFPEQAPFIVAGGPDFQAEVAHVTEVGYRGSPAAALNYSLTLFRYDWDQLRSGSGQTLPVYLVNNIEGESYGAELWGNWQVVEGWRLRAGFNTLDKDLQFEPGTSDTVGVANGTLHNDPDYQWLLRSSHDFGTGLQLDLQLRRIGALEVEPAPAYSELDVRLGWQPLDNLEITLVGNNMLHNRHGEYAPGVNGTEFGRSYRLGFRWSL